MNEKCENCKFSRWDAVSDYFQLHCHYDTPMIVPDVELGQWPKLQPDSFCGRYEETPSGERAL